MNTKPSTRREPVRTVDTDYAWSLLLALRDAGAATHTNAVIALDGHGCLEEGDERAQEGPGAATRANPAIVLDPQAPRGWRVTAERAAKVTDAAAQLLDLFIPLCTGPGAADRVVAHLAQSLDGRVATASGSSQFISGHEDLKHTHRLRALSDAVIVGARTVEHDDPQLTTRLVPGPHPTRVVLDPRGRLGCDHRVFTTPEVPTVLVRGEGAAPWRGPATVRQLEVAWQQAELDVPALRQALASLGLRRLFVEGGGITVSGFLRAGALHRLHLAVAPIVLGSGRPSVVLPPIDALDDALRLQCQHFCLGGDILFDCPLPS